MVEMAMSNFQRVITPKVELRFMCSAHRLMVLFIAVKFRENISVGISVMKQARNYKALADGRTHEMGVMWWLF